MTEAETVLDDFSFFAFISTLYWLLFPCLFNICIKFNTDRTDLLSELCVRS